MYVLYMCICICYMKEKKVSLKLQWDIRYTEFTRRNTKTGLLNLDQVQA